MQILPITSLKFNTACHRKSTPNFKAHPDFYKYNSLQSCYFRRGAVALASKGYNDIEEVFKKVFNREKNKLKNLLIVGIGNSQEPFSYLASIKSILKDKPLKKNVNLHTIDLQSKLDENNIWQNAFYDAEWDLIPKFAKTSFIKDEKYSKKEPNIDNISPDEIYPYIYQLLFGKTPNTKETRKTEYRVNDEILNFLKDTYNNPEKSKWDSRVQETVLDYPDKTFDIVSANNVLPYIISENEILKTINQIKRTLKPGGYFITDPYEYPNSMKEKNVLDSFKEISKGIYQKTE